MGLKRYREMRDFRKTPEPSGAVRPSKGPRPRFVVQKHAATRLHYDFRLEMDGVLRSWAVPKGPHLDPHERHLAVHVEDHPMDYADFEGTIPKGEYGGGSVIVWDRGTWAPIGDAAEGYRKGTLAFELFGEKLRGEWRLVRMKGRDEGGKENWLLVKHGDAEAREGSAGEITALRPESVKTGRRVEDLGGKDAVWHSKSAARRKNVPARPDADLLGARRGAFPASVALQVATSAKAPPDGDDWIHELAYGGLRFLARVKDGRATFAGAGTKSLAKRLPSLGEALAALPVRAAVLDGELVRVGADGRPAPPDLADRSDDERLHAYAYDLLHLDGRDLRAVPLVRRKEALRALLPTPDGRVLFADHVRGRGPRFLDEACRMGLEGIVSKRAAAPRRAGRSKDWLFVACAQAEKAPGRTPRRTRAIARPAAASTGLTNPDKVLWPADGVTKAELAAYYDAVAERMLPHLLGRPLMLLRCPNGVGRPCFVQKHVEAEPGPGLAGVRVEQGGEGPELHASVTSREGLRSLVQLGVLEVHSWGARADALDKPDQIVFDLDPAPDVPFADVVAAALGLRKRLRSLGLQSFAKTTGGKGLHVEVPLARAQGWDLVKDFAHAVALAMTADEPDRFLAVMSKAARKGKIFVDWLRNGRGATAVAPYSTRARAGATVATPLAWDEVVPDLDPARWTVKTVPERVRTEPWVGFFRARQRLAPAMRRLGASYGVGRNR